MALLARELVALKPDVIVAGSTSGALAAHRATRTIPIVINTAEDPAASRSRRARSNRPCR
jgi:ABC-type uncharacterized transport system substrate-binding protein